MSHKTVFIGLGLLLVGSGLVPGCGRSGDVVGGSDGGFTGTGGGEGGKQVLNFEPCAQDTQKAKLVDVNMYILVDKSGSMDNDNKWTNTEQAFTSFFQSPDAAPLNVALRFWPDEGCEDLDPNDMNNNDPTCDIVPCSVPQVAVGPLLNAAHQQALIDLFASKNPGGATPMSAALEGGILWARQQKDANPDEAAIVVLVTDGEPNGCLENPDSIEQIVTDGFQNEGVPIYAVGLEGSGVTLMNQIATAGGTNDAFFIGSMNGEAELLAAMLDIAQQSIQCSIPIPEPAGNEILDPELVRIEYLTGSGETILVPQVDDVSECGAEGGWYYDDNANPSSITFCSATCGTVQLDVEATVDVALGCECETDADCPGDNLCVDHKCIDPCTDDSQCPFEHICIAGRCTPEQGDECKVDADCPFGLRCIGGQCSAGGVIVGRHEAVQGGAFNCSTTRGTDDSKWGFLLASALLAGAFTTRRSAQSARAKSARRTV
jgi:hypothetical protein